MRTGTPAARVRVASFALLLVALLWPGLGQPSAAAAAAPCQQIVVPAYFDPGPAWRRAIAAAPATGIMILNPNSGPDQYLEHWATVTRRAQAAGIKVIGYVRTDRARRAPAVVKKEIDRYFDWYQVDGIFLDEATGEAKTIPYFRALAAHVRGSTGGAIVALNPVFDLDRGYMAFVDILVVYEYGYDAYRSKKLPDWLDAYPADRFIHIVYDVPGHAAARETLKLAKKRNAGYVFVTDRSDPAQIYKSLGGLWTDMVKAVCSSR